ncbi:unnamed protein product [Closterium sp. Naga37s-1]|nr:unnamed protein product [Closterium sp. Naga37s-1]
MLSCLSIVSGPLAPDAMHQVAWSPHAVVTSDVTSNILSPPLIFRLPSPSLPPAALPSPLRASFRPSPSLRLVALPSSRRPPFLPLPSRPPAALLFPRRAPFPPLSPFVSSPLCRSSPSFPLVPSQSPSLSPPVALSFPVALPSTPCPRHPSLLPSHLAHFSLPGISLAPHVLFPASPHPLPCFPPSPSVLPPIPFRASPHPLPCFPPSPSLLPPIPFRASPHPLPCLPPSPPVLPPIPFRASL